MIKSAQEWHGTDVTVAEVVARLSAMQLSTARQALIDSDSVHPRNSELDISFRFPGGLRV